MQPEPIVRKPTIVAGRGWHTMVVIPARDEERTILAALQSVAKAVDQRGADGGESAIVLVADRCRDRTAVIARSFAERRDDVWVLETEASNVGVARAAGVQHARAVLGDPDPQRTWICNTDADTEVPAEWIRRQLAYAHRGIAAVAGIVDVEDFEDFDGHAPAVASRFRSTYLDLLPSDGSDHPHVHGANLGVRLDAYLHVGGWSPLQCSEDHDLWNRLRAYGYSSVSPADLTVVTSGRAHGRCVGGFADALRSHAY